MVLNILIYGKISSHVLVLSPLVSLGIFLFITTFNSFASIDVLNLFSQISFVSQAIFFIPALIHCTFSPNQ